MRKSKKENEDYYAISAFVSVILAVLIHYLFISSINLHSTVHAVISIFIFFLLSAAISALLAKVWNKF